jgi:hypothetical protein
MWVRGCARAVCVHVWGCLCVRVIQNMKPLLEHDYHWVYLAAVIFGRMICFVNMYPMSFKSKVSSSLANLCAFTLTHTHSNI